MVDFSSLLLTDEWLDQLVDIFLVIISRVVNGLTDLAWLIGWSCGLSMGRWVY